MKQSLQSRIADQIKWSDGCGGSLAGYVARYGVKGEPVAAGMAPLHHHIQAGARNAMTRKIPEALDLTRPSNRLACLRAYHAVLSEGLDEREAKSGAVAYALRNWKEIMS